MVDGDSDLLRFGIRRSRSHNGLHEWIESVGDAKLGTHDHSAFFRSRNFGCRIGNEALERQHIDDVSALDEFGFFRWDAYLVGILEPAQVNLTNKHVGWDTLLLKPVKDNGQRRVHRHVVFCKDQTTAQRPRFLGSMHSMTEELAQIVTWGKKVRRELRRGR